MSKVLVAYFSASGVTKEVAERLAEGIGADLYEIVPQVPYTKADLDWTDKQSRSTIEMNDKDCRPAISGKVENMEQYDVIFAGFPVWWYRQPSIIDTFLESYDLSGKTIVPFATSGSSQIGDSGRIMQELAKGAVVVEGKRFPANVSSDELKAWASEWL